MKKEKDVISLKQMNILLKSIEETQFSITVIKLTALAVFIVLFAGLLLNAFTVGMAVDMAKRVPIKQVK